MFTVIIVVCSLKSMYVPGFVLIGCCVRELYGHLCPYRNVWPEAFVVVLQELHCLPKFWYVYIIVFMDFYPFPKVRPSIQSVF